MAKCYGKLPAETLGLDPAIWGDWALYQLNAAVMTLGRKVENALAENAGKKKSQRQRPESILYRLLYPKVNERAFASLGHKAAPTGKVEPGDDLFKIMLDKG